MSGSEGAPGQRQAGEVARGAVVLARTPHAVQPTGTEAAPRLGEVIAGALLANGLD